MQPFTPRRRGFTQYKLGACYILRQKKLFSYAFISSHPLSTESFNIRSTKRVQGTSFTPTAKSQPTYKYNADIQHQLHFSDINGPKNRLFNKSSRWTACRAQKPIQYRSSLIRSCAYSSLNNAKDLFSKEGKLQPYLCIAACLV